MIVNVNVDKVLALALEHDTDNWFFKLLDYSYDALSYLWLAVSTGVASILFFFSVYYILPNRKVPWRPVLRTSIITGRGLAGFAVRLRDRCFRIWISNRCMDRSMCPWDCFSGRIFRD